MSKARREGGKRHRKRKQAIEVGQNPRRKRKRRKVASNVVQPIIGRGTTRFGKRRKPRGKEAQDSQRIIGGNAGDLQPNKLYKLISTTIVWGAAVSVNQGIEDKTELWHHRLRHISQKELQELHKQGLLEDVSSCKLDFCEYCVLGKQRKVSFTSNSADNRSKEQLSYIHSDVWGPAPTKSNGGVRYFVTFMDDFSRKVWVYFMKQKSEIFAKFKEWKTEIENQTGRKIKYLRSDNGGEYTINEFTDYCKQEGIIRHFTVKKNPQ
ncbi:hypothetical protein L3X38_018623 [Prunus dulcis]|uniref:Integrase catalytic domain-containing protein n=1 Tax=Prunus dulcis TaxID=3755 RepID=A0AAD4ZB69_PRUDU|nr:hypothetical protein L3X38_018623 [Prunus dulcis]